MERINALPCPFCGENPKFRQSKITYCQLHGEPSQSFIVHCTNHRCLVNPSVLGGDATWKGHEQEERQKAVIRWNARPAETALAAEVERLKSENLQLGINAAKGCVAYWTECAEAPSGGQSDDDALCEARQTLAALLAQQTQEG